MILPEGQSLDPTRLRLLQAKLGSLSEWKKPGIVQSIGPFEPDAFDDFDARRTKLIEECCERLRGYDEAGLASITGSSGNRDGPGREWHAFMAGDIDRLTRRMPPWYAGGFGHPSHLADFEYWAKMPSFKVAELTCLSVGINPGEFPNDVLVALVEKFDDLFEPVKFLVRRYEQLRRKFDPSHRNWSVSPRDMLDWTAQVEFDVHPQFLGRLRQWHGPREAARSTTGTNRPVDRREINSIATIIAIIAIDKMRYVPGANRSEIPKKISDLAAQHGIAISQETVRKYLSLGASFLK